MLRIASSSTLLGLALCLPIMSPGSARAQEQDPNETPSTEGSDDRGENEAGQPDEPQPNEQTDEQETDEQETDEQETDELSSGNESGEELGSGDESGDESGERDGTDGTASSPDDATGETSGDDTPADESSEGLGADPDDDRLQLIVIDAAPYGVDPVVGRHVSHQMRATAQALGYDVMTQDDTIAAAQRLRMPYPPTPADLWRVTYISQSQRGAFARVWASSGRYVIEIAVASLDGTGPFFARGDSGSDDLHAVVDRLFRQALPSPTVWQGEQTNETTPEPEIEPDPERNAARRARERRNRRRERDARLRRWHLVLQTEGAIGTSQDVFYNHLVGGRLDYRISQEVLLGGYVGYANLRGKDGRSDNILFYLQVEDRVRIVSSSDITVPLRLGVGYLPFNGPFVRIAAGINIPLSRRFQLGFDILAPTFWVLPERTAVSMNVAAELIIRL
ncbi:MAG: hypothetical protein AAGF12_01920 [Myxococcota bacterium]